MEQKLFDGLEQMQKFTDGIKEEPVDQHLESLNSEVIYFLIWAVFLNVKSNFVIRSISRVF